jgi:hypothetical protein
MMRCSGREFARNSASAKSVKNRVRAPTVISEVSMTHEKFPLAMLSASRVSEVSSSATSAWPPNVMRAMNSTSGGKNHWKLISIVCFPDPDINGEYFSEMDYRMLYQLAPRIQSAFEAADEAFSVAREELKAKIDKSRSEP